MCLKLHQHYHQKNPESLELHSADKCCLNQYCWPLILSKSEPSFVVDFPLELRVHRMFACKSISLLMREQSAKSPLLGRQWHLSQAFSRQTCMRNLTLRSTSVFATYVLLSVKRQAYAHGRNTPENLHFLWPSARKRQHGFWAMLAFLSTYSLLFKFLHPNILKTSTQDLSYGHAGTWWAAVRHFPEDCSKSWDIPGVLSPQKGISWPNFISMQAPKTLICVLSFLRKLQHFSGILIPWKDGGMAERPLQGIS